MKPFFTLFLTLLIALALGCGKKETQDTGIDHRIEAPSEEMPTEEQVVAKLYSHFYNLLAGGKVEVGTPFPADDQFCLLADPYLVFIWSYYSSPDEIKRFELSIPAEHLQRIDASYVTTVPLVLAEKDLQEEIRTMVVEEKR